MDSGQGAASIKRWTRSDRKILRLVRKWLNAGVMEDGAWTESKAGTPQGATISPLLANIYLHYVLDLWIQPWRTRRATGDMIIVRYDDDFLVGFQRHADAVRFLEELRERLRRFSLDLHPDKTRWISFGLLEGLPGGTGARTRARLTGYRPAPWIQHGRLALL